MSTARKLSREDKRRRIIDAAIQVFAAKGFFGARVSEIAEAAGVADGTIYLYFKSKDDVLISLFEEKMSSIMERLMALLEDHPGDPEAKIRRYIVEHLRLVAEQPSLMQVLTIELRQSARFIKEYHPKAFRAYLELLQGIVEDGQRQGVFRSDLDPLVFRRALFGAIDEISLEWILMHMEESRGEGRTPRDPNEVAAQFSDFIIRGLRP
ncbi:MAG: TetR/AcrR family transcriptional regulator [Myxococcota bacterium]